MHTPVPGNVRQRIDMEMAWESGKLVSPLYIARWGYESRVLVGRSTKRQSQSSLDLRKNFDRSVARYMRRVYRSR